MAGVPVIPKVSEITNLQCLENDYLIFLRAETSSLEFVSLFQLDVFRHVQSSQSSKYAMQYLFRNHMLDFCD